MGRRCVYGARDFDLEAHVAPVGTVEKYVELSLIDRGVRVDPYRDTVKVRPDFRIKHAIYLMHIRLF